MSVKPALTDGIRRAFLCNVDHYSGHDYEHQRDWLENQDLLSQPVPDHILSKLTVLNYNVMNTNDSDHPFFIAEIKDPIPFKSAYIPGLIELTY